MTKRRRHRPLKTDSIRGLDAGPNGNNKATQHHRHGHYTSEQKEGGSLTSLLPLPLEAVVGTTGTSGSTKHSTSSKRQHYIGSPEAKFCFAAKAPKIGPASPPLSKHATKENAERFERAPMHSRLASIANISHHHQQPAWVTD